MMEAVSRIFKIAATNFHITSIRPMPCYSYFPLGIRTTACHMSYSTSSLYQNADCTRSTAIYQLSASVGSVAV